MKEVGLTALRAVLGRGFFGFLIFLLLAEQPAELL